MNDSKCAQGVSYSVTRVTTVIKSETLPTLSSIYTAELATIYAACKYAENLKKKCVICSDSLAALHSVTNTNNQSFYTVFIRDILNQPKIVLIWIPGHKNIPGNDTADLGANEAHKSLMLFNTTITLQAHNHSLIVHSKNKRERYSQVSLLSDTRYSAFKLKIYKSKVKIFVYLLIYSPTVGTLTGYY